MTPEQESPKTQPIVDEGAPKAKATVVEEAPKAKSRVVEESGNECKSSKVVASQQQNGTSLQQTNGTTSESEGSDTTKKEEWFNPKDLKLGDLDSYIEGRWNDQYIYFQRKANNSQKWFNRIQVWILLLGFLSILIMSFDLDKLVNSVVEYFFNKKIDLSVFSPTKVLCTLISGFIVVLTGYDKLKKFKEEWIKNRKSEEMLKGEMSRYMGGIEPYASLNCEEDDEEEKVPSQDEQPPLSGRTKKLLIALDQVAVKYDDAFFKELYKDIKNQLGEYVAATNNYTNSTDPITDKDKTFVSRINAIVEKSRQMFDDANLYRSIKDEISDFYTNCGAYKVEPPAKKKKKKRLTLDDIKAENGRMLMTRTEAIIANDVTEFVNTTTSCAEQKKKDDNDENAK